MPRLAAAAALVANGKRSERNIRRSSRRCATTGVVLVNGNAAAAAAAAAIDIDAQLLQAKLCLGFDDLFRDNNTRRRRPRRRRTGAALLYRQCQCQSEGPQPPTVVYMNMPSRLRGVHCLLHDNRASREAEAKTSYRPFYNRSQVGGRTN